MNKHALIISGLVLAAAGVATSYACEVYWTSVQAKPAFIVVGTVSEVINDAFVLPPGELPDGKRMREVHDTGWIEVEQVLFGDPIARWLPISWFAATRVDPTSPGSSYVDFSTGETYTVGDRRIWVLWRRDRVSDKFSMYLDIQALPVESLKKVKKEIRDMSKK
jgi:hypothetical protein